VNETGVHWRVRIVPAPTGYMDAARSSALDLASGLDHDIQQLKVPAMDLSSKPDRSLIRSALALSTAATGVQRSLQFQLHFST
jgi:hypothetical protein